MAITKTKHITTTLKKAIDYICNEKKTDGSILISSFGCAPETADLEFEMTAEKGTGRGSIQAYHLIQSFKPGEVSAKEAHQIGMEWAKKILGDQYEFVLSTHIDRNHIHNHLIFNSTSFVTHAKYNDCRKSLRYRMRASDQLCKEHGLSVITKKSGIRGRGKYEYKQLKAGTSWKEQLRIAIDDAISQATNYEEFNTIMELKGYEITMNKNDDLKFREIGLSRSIKVKSFGEFYSEDMIKDRIERKDYYKDHEFVFSEQESNKQKTNKLHKSKEKLSLIVDLQENLKAQQSKAYKHTLEISNVNQLFNTISFLEKNNCNTYDEFQSKYDSVKESYNICRKECSELEDKLSALSEKIKYCQTFFKVAKNARLAIRNPVEMSKYKKEVVLYNTCLKYFSDNGINIKDISIKSMIAEYKQMSADKKKSSERLKELRSDFKEYNIIKSNIDMNLNTDKKRKKDANER